MSRKLRNCRPECANCTERCRCSLLSPKSEECKYADGVAGTGVQEQLNIRAMVALKIKKESNKREDGK